LLYTFEDCERAQRAYQVSFDGLELAPILAKRCGIGIQREGFELIATHCLFKHLDLPVSPV